jgi:hypothetical protein
MSWLDRLLNSRKSHENTDSQKKHLNLKHDAPKKDKKRYSTQIQRLQSVPMAEIGQDKLRAAIAQAEDPNFPLRYELYMIYKEVMRDFHLKSQVRTAIFKVVKEPFVVSKGGKPSEDLTVLLQKQWFEDCLWLALEAEFYGHSLIEFQPMQEIEGRMEFTQVKLIPREHVRPETHEILLRPFDHKGIDYTMPGLDSIYLPAGDSEDLGLLADAARYAIYKKYSMGDWANSSEKFGDPILIVQTASDDEKENNKKEAWARSFGKDGYAILDDQDKINLLQRNSQGTAHLIYKDFMSAMDDENSKGVNGQVSTSDEKSFVGSAEVQERILNDYTEARLRAIYYFVNNMVLPFLVKNGGVYEALKGCVWSPMKPVFSKGDGGSLEKKPQKVQMGQPRW